MPSLVPRLFGIATLAALGACAQITGVADYSIDDATDAGGAVPGEEAGARSDASVADAPSAGDAAAPTDQSAPDASASDGSPPPPACTSTAGPALVHVASFCIDATEVTNDQYASFLAAKPATTLAPSPACAFKTQFTPSAGWPAGSGKGAYPVVYVDWCDAYAYCAWAGKHLCGAIAGGPSSKADAANKDVDEWYVACSKAGANVYPYGGNAYVQGKCNDTEALSHGARPVGSFAGCEGGYAGIFDMNGNAYEWEDACDVSAGASDACVIRGGSWNFSGAGYGGCNTYFNDYTVKRSDTFNDTGFRCCDR